MFLRILFFNYLQCFNFIFSSSNKTAKQQQKTAKKRGSTSNKSINQSQSSMKTNSQSASRNTVQRSAQEQAKTYLVTKATQGNKKPQEEPGAQPKVYAVEDTPMEMSRCTSLSNITIESEKFDMKKILQGKSQQQNSQQQRGLKTEQVQLKAKLSNQGKYPGYLQSLPASDEIRRYDNEGSIGARTSFSAFSSLSNSHKNDHKVMQEILMKNSATHEPPKEGEFSPQQGFSQVRGFTNRLSTCQEEEDGEHQESEEKCHVEKSGNLEKSRE